MKNSHQLQKPSPNKQSKSVQANPQSTALLHGEKSQYKWLLLLLFIYSYSAVVATGDLQRTKHRPGSYSVQAWVKVNNMWSNQYMTGIGPTPYCQRASRTRYSLRLDWKEWL